MKNIDLSTIIIGARVCYTVPNRGGHSFGFGKVTKINRKTVNVTDEKYPGEEKLQVDKRLITEIIIFEKPKQKVNQLDMFVA